MSALLLKLKAALEDLAAPANEQATALRAKVSPDELALEFEAFAAAAQSLVESGELSAEAHELICALDTHLEAFSGPNNAEEWSEAALYRSPHWAKARQLAAKTLALIRP